MFKKEYNNSVIRQKNEEEVFKVLSELHRAPDLTQRQISIHLNMSLGKVNYILKYLIDNRWLLANSFSKNHKPKRIKYLITQEGLKEKLRLTYYFLKRKEEEYIQVKEEWEKSLSTKYENE